MIILKMNDIKIEKYTLSIAKLKAGLLAFWEKL